MLSNSCLYTIKHSSDLLLAMENGGKGAFEVKTKMVMARTLLDQALDDGLQMPVIFAPAEDTRYLLGWAILEELILDKSTRYTFSSLKLFDRRLSKTQLRKVSNGRPISKGFRRTYAICKTPRFLTSKITNPCVFLPDELDPNLPLTEGALRKVLVNAYERNSEARRRCIEYHGSICCICGFDFGKVYGEIAEGFIHVHHITPFSKIRKEYEVDPIQDLRPVCANCHAVIHLGGTIRHIDEVKRLIEKATGAKRN